MDFSPRRTSMLFRTRPREAAAAFVHPLDPQPRTAILVPGFRSTRSVRIFPHGWDRASKKFAPAAVAATFQQLAALRKERVELTHAVICLAWHRHDLLTPQKSDLLWESFGVPIFEQYLGPGNVLLAFECQAHSDFHATPGYSGPILEGKRCPCGSHLPLCSMTRDPLMLRPTG